MSSEKADMPWRLDGEDTLQNGNRYGFFFSLPDGTRIGETFVNCLFDADDCEANARRIVASVNALAGMSIEKIEDMANLRRQGTPFMIFRAADMAQADGTLAYADATIRQMLAALQLAEGFMSGFEDDEAQEGMAEKLSTIRAAIAEASK